MIGESAGGVRLPGITVERAKSSAKSVAKLATGAKRPEHRDRERQAVGAKTKTKTKTRRWRRTKRGDRQVGKFQALVTKGRFNQSREIQIGSLRVPVTVKINSKGNRLTIEF